MFGSFVEECVGWPDAALDERLRANELELRRLTAERAALVGVAEHRAIFSGEQRSMSAYLRATTNCSDGSATRDRKLGRLLTEHPEVGEALRAGHITVDAAGQICRVQSNRRIRHLLPVVVPVLVELAEHSSHGEFADEVTKLIAQLDQDGAFADTASAVEGRRATVVEVGGELVVSAHGGDPVQAAQVKVVVDSFVEGEYRKDVDVRRELYGDDADQHPLPRNHGQRGFDALLAIVAAAAASPEGRALPEPVVNLLVDDQSGHDTLAHAGIVLPNGNRVELGRSSRGCAPRRNDARSRRRAVRQRVPDDAPGEPSLPAPSHVRRDRPRHRQADSTLA